MRSKKIRINIENNIIKIKATTLEGVVHKLKIESKSSTTALLLDRALTLANVILSEEE